MNEQTDAPAKATIHPSIAWPVIIVVVVFIGGWLYAYAGASVFSPWWLLAAGPMLAALGTVAARAHWPEGDYGVPHTRAGVRLARLAGLGAGVWLWWAGTVSPAQAAPLLALGGLPLWGWFAVLSWTAPRKAEQMVQRYEDGRQMVEARGWRTILDQAGCDDVVITEVREHRAGVALTVEPAPDAKKPPTYDEFAGRAPAIGGRAATYIRQTKGSRIPRGAVRTEPGRDDAEFLVHITVRDVFGEATTYVPDYVPGDIKRALDMGEFDDAARLMLAMVGHLKIVGATGAGKSNLANNLIGRITGCANALVWVAATSKFVPLVWPWLRPCFEGKTTRPLLDYVAGETAWSVLVLLRDAYKLMCERNARLDDSSSLRVSSDEPAVFVFVEEVSHGVEFTDTIDTHDGQTVTISDLLKMITQGGRSAEVWLVMMSQFGINVALGERAAETIRNTTMRICLRTLESHDGSRTLPGLPSTVDTTQLANHTMYVQPSTDEPRAFPAKAPMLDGAEQIEPVAIGNTRWRPVGVEDESNLGYEYATRWDRDRLPVLASRVDKRGWSWPAIGQQPEPVPAGDVDTVEDTTEWSDAAWRDILGESGPPRPVEQSTAGPFELDRGAMEDDLAKLNRLADEMGGPVPGPDGDVYPGGHGVPAPLDLVVAWLDAQEQAGVRHADDHEYPTETLRVGIGYAGPARSLGRSLGDLGLSSRNCARRYDEAQRKGFRVRDIRERAQRFRFGMP